MDRLNLCLKEECLGQSEVPQLQEGGSMMGWWEGDLYRGVIIKILEEKEEEILVRFVAQVTWPPLLGTW